MAQRDLSENMLAEVAAPTNYPCHLVEVTTELGGTPTITYMTDYSRDLSWDGNTYIAAGNLLGVGDISETAEFQISKVRLSLSGIDQSIVSLFLNNNYLDQQAIVRLAMIDSSGGVVANPTVLFQGNIDSVTLEEDPDAGTSTVSANASSLFVDFQRLSGRHTTDSEQQYLFSGDLFFQPAVNIAATKEWGK